MEPPNQGPYLGVAGAAETENIAKWDAQLTLSDQQAWFDFEIAYDMCPPDVCCTYGEEYKKLKPGQMIAVEVHSFMDIQFQGIECKKAHKHTDDEDKYWCAYDSREYPCEWGEP